MSSRKLALHVIQELQRQGHTALLAGGCVRDLLLGHEPKDFDVATSARPDQILRVFPDARGIGAHFGVVLVWQEDAKVEVATFRRDHQYRDGRRPENVTFSGRPEEDVRRRDFTINGLLLEPFSQQVFDYVGGRADLSSRVVRAIGDPRVRFAEDHLRMLRAVRFAARLDFAVEPATMQAIQEQCGYIVHISAERVRDELNRILTEGGARRGFELLDESGLLALILPEVAAMKGVEQPPEFHPEGDVWTHTLLMLENLVHPTVTLALGTLLHDVGKPETFTVSGRIRFNGHVEAGERITEAICRRLRYSNAETEQAVALVKHHMRFKDAPKMRPGKLKQFLRLPAFEEHLELHRLDCLGSHRQLGNYEFVQRQLASLSAEELRPPRLLTGTDLTALGYEPGPLFREILGEVEEAQLDGAITTKDEARRFVLERYPLPGCARP